MIAVLASFFVQLGSHYFPWARLIGKRKLPRLMAYVIGTFTIGVIFSIWLIASNETPTLLVFWAIVIASGLGVCTGWGLDWVLSTKDRAREAEQRERQLLEMRNDEPSERS